MCRNNYCEHLFRLNHQLFIQRILSRFSIIITLSFNLSITSFWVKLDKVCHVQTDEIIAWHQPIYVE
jgi:hypothetical protein